MALESLGRDPISRRDFSALTMIVDPTRLPEAKERVLRFKRELGELLEKGEPSEVYSLAIQLFPLTREGGQ